MSTYVGRCSNCGGAVVTPTGWMHAYEPAPRECMQCGARAHRPGPTIPMGPPRERDARTAQQQFADAMAAQARHPNTAPKEQD